MIDVYAVLNFLVNSLGKTIQSSVSRRVNGVVGV